MSHELTKIEEIFRNYFLKEKYRKLINIKAEHKIITKRKINLKKNILKQWRRISKSNKIKALIEQK